MNTLVLAQSRQWLWFYLVAKAFFLALLTLFATFAVTYAQAPSGEQTYLPFAGQTEPEILIPGLRGAPASCMDDLVAGKLNCTAEDVGVARFSVLNGVTECFEGANVDVFL